MLRPGLQRSHRVGSSSSGGRRARRNVAEKPHSFQKPEHDADAAVAVSVASSGSSLLQKLIFFGVIIGGVSIWIKAHKGRSAAEKSLA